MITAKPISIILVSCYCFLLGLFSLSLEYGLIFNNRAALSNSHGELILAVIASLGFSTFLVVVGLGFLNLNQLCWNILFFGLMICVSIIASLILVCLILLLVYIDIIYSFFHAFQISPITWFSFLCFFLSEIIVLYYLTRSEVRDCFGDMGNLVKPF